MITYALPEPYAIGAEARLKARPDLTRVTNPEDAELLLIRSRTRVDAEFLKRAKRLRFVVTATSGFDHVDWRATHERGVVVAHVPEANAVSTAELTLALLLACERDLASAFKNVRANRWREGLTRPRGLSGLTLGIVGLGRVGLRVARITAALGMRVQAYDPYLDEDAFGEVERTGFTELLRSSDYVSLHVPLTKETKHLIDNQTLGEMPREARLINTCRGPVVDENDLLTALDARVIDAAAIDVIEREPPPAGHRLLTHPRCLITPHVGAFTEAAWARASDEAVTKLEAFLDGRPVGDTLPLSVPWFMGSI